MAALSHATLTPPLTTQSVLLAGRRARTAGAVLIAIALAGCATSQGSSSHFGGTGVYTDTYESAGNDVTVEMRLEVARGTVTVQVVDPSGVNRFATDLEAPASFERQLTFPGESGRWQLIQTLRDAEGDIEVVWRESPLGGLRRVQSEEQQP